MVFMMSVTIRSAIESDIPDLVNVHRSGFSSNELRYFGESFQKMAKVFAEVEADSFESMIQKPSFRKDWWLVAEISDRVVGEARGFPSWSREIGHFIFLVDLIVHKDFRRRGIGSQLLVELSSRASKKGYQAVITTPEDIDGPVYNFYVRNGYAIWFSFDRMFCSAKRMESPLEYDVQSATIISLSEVREMNEVSLPAHVLERKIALSLEARDKGEGDCLVAKIKEKPIGHLLVAPFFPRQSRLTLLLDPEYTSKDNVAFLLSLGMKWIIRKRKRGAVIRTRENYKNLFRSFGFEEREKGLYMIRRL